MSVHEIVGKTRGLAAGGSAPASVTLIASLASLAPLASLAALLATSGCAPVSDAVGADAGVDASTLRPLDAPRLASPSARERVRQLQTRFRRQGALDAQGALGVAAGGPVELAAPVIGPGEIERLEPMGDGHFRAVPTLPTPGAASTGGKPATVLLPRGARGAVRLEDAGSKTAVTFALREASEAEVELVDGLALYRRAVAGGDLVHRANATGTEDFVAFETPPAHEELTYDVDVSHVAGLRLVSGTLELLDAKGAPRLRVAPPYVVDTNGVRTPARLSVEGCAFDADPRAPWGRAVTPPGAARCAVRVAWHGVRYPALVDPEWTTTGSMATARQMHTATTIAPGTVLIAGGWYPNYGYVSAAELYDASSNSFAATGSMATPRFSYAAVRLGSGKVLVVGGISGTTTRASTAELYDPTAGVFVATGSMAAPRIAHTATLLPSGKVLVVGGRDTVGPVYTSELFDPAGAGSFAPTAVMSISRSGHAAALLGSGKVLIVGGTYDTTKFSALSSAAVFDPAGAGSFSYPNAMATARTGPTATTLPSGKVLVTGGEDWGGTPLSTAELFDPGAGTFANVGPLSVARAGHSATLLGSGRVLVVGGYADLTYTWNSTAEVFEPDGATSNPLSSAMALHRYYHSASLLPSGSVLIAGGFGTSSAELFSPLPAGTACSTSGECASGTCDGGFCCAAACPNAGVCQKCAAGSGACVAVTNGTDVDGCVGSCDAAAICQQSLGQACGAGVRQCASGHCVDGVCCDAVCDKPCDACSKSAGAPADGKCTAVPEGRPGTPACAPYACDGVATSCATRCNGDSGCAAGYFCDASGQCVQQRAQGSVCDPSAGAHCYLGGCRECVTGQCVDGVCCGTPCTGLCQSCSAAKKASGADDGVCGDTKDGLSPSVGSCPADAVSTCGADGLCDGVGGCRLFYRPGTVCAPSVCLGSTAVAKTCDGAGACLTETTGKSCAPGSCSGGTCRVGCIVDADCAPGAWCGAGVCSPQLANGTKCGNDRACASGACVDGYCCNGSCPGQCEACNVAGSEGTCSPVVGSPHGSRRVCPVGTAANPCGAATCDGVSRTGCKPVGADVGCGEEKCQASKTTSTGHCDGTGKCQSPPAISCNAYACDATRCRTSCQTHADCSGNNRCDAQGHCGPAARCDGDHLVTSADGTSSTDCSPYRCAETGGCKKSCSTSLDCAQGFLCSDETCQPQSSDAGSSGGCALRARDAREPARPRQAVVALALALLVGLSRRRRRAPVVAARRRST
jgi:hypothetical protein